MRTTKTVPNQSLYDLALQLYGNVDAIIELLALNPEYTATGPDLADAVPERTTINYDETSALRNTDELKKLPKDDKGNVLPIATWEGEAI
jgi:hypothetical protein